MSCLSVHWLQLCDSSIEACTQFSWKIVTSQVFISDKKRQAGFGGAEPFNRIKKHLISQVSLSMGFLKCKLCMHNDPCVQTHICIFVQSKPFLAIAYSTDSA